MPQTIRDLPAYLARNGLGAGTGTTSGAPVPMNPQSQDMANISYILNPNFDTSEIISNAAENAVAGGVPGSGFAGGQQLRLLESEKLDRFKTGHQMLEPYNQRSFQAAQAEADRQAQLNAIAAQGAQAMQQLQLQEAGQTARATAAERAAMERQIEAGRQAMMQLQLQEAGQSSRLTQSIAGNLDVTRLGIAGDLLKTGLAKDNMPPLYPQNNFNWVTGVSTPARASTVPTAGNTGFTGTSMSSVDGILRKYGLLR